MRIQFSKMSGAGNDFVVVDNRNKIITEPEEFSRSVCHRRFGIGADGVLLLESSDIADFTMKYYNADGSNTGMCGNGGRCIAKFAFDLQIVTSNTFIFDGFGYKYTAVRINTDRYRLKMKDPFDKKINQEITHQGSTIKANYLNSGTDHTIVFLDDNPVIQHIDSMDVIGLGKFIRYHDHYKPKGTNVNFVHRLDGNKIKIRTYERGVEDETLACGTGSVASAVLSADRYGFTSPVSVEVKSGETLEIDFKVSKESIGLVTDVYLEGSAKTIFVGYWDI